jgi:hypothetical protein
MHKHFFAFTWAIGAISGAVQAAEQINLPCDCREMPAEQMIDESFSGKNDWRQWKYRRSIEADLNKDGKAETIWLLADLEQQPQADGKPSQWQFKDSAPWAVVIESPTKKQTLVYLEWSQFGRVDAMVVNEKDNANLVIINRQSEAISLYEIKYQRPNQYRVCQILQRDILATAN